MSVQIITGPSGAGKTRYAMEALIKSASENPEKTHLYIVPEQFTLQTQKALVNLHKGHVVMDIDILSFNRLSFRVFKELGVDTFDVLEDTGKNLILRKLIKENKDSLLVLKDKGLNMSYVDEVKSLISEMMQYRVGPDKLRLAVNAPGINSLFKAKAQDICLLYEKFEEYLSGSFITAEKLLEKLFDVMADSDFLRDSVVVFDGFTGFTPIQGAVVERLLGKASELIFTATMDEAAYNDKRIFKEELFFMSKSFVSDLRRMADERHVPVRDDIFIDGKNGRFKDGLPKVSINSVRSPVEELHFVAGKIRELVRSGRRYNSIAILSGNQDIYTPFIEDVFSEYDIPVFVDKSRTVGFHPLMGFLYSIKEVLKYNFKAKTVISLVKNPMMPLTEGETDLFENYILATGIRGKSGYSKDFKKCPKSFSKEELYSLNDTRNRLMETLDSLISDYAGDKAYPVSKMNRDLYTFLDNIGVERKLADRGEEEIFGLIIDVLEKMEELISDEMMSFSDYMDVLFAGLGAGKLGLLPRTKDMVVFGDTVRTRLDDIDTLFVIGANDGVLPPVGGGGGFFSERDRNSLEPLDIKLAPGERERNFAGIFYMYLMYTRASKELYVSYPRTDCAGNETNPSFILGVIADYYGLKKDEFPEGETLVNTVAGGEKRLASLLKKYVDNETDEGEKEELYALYHFFKDRKPEVIDKILMALNKRGSDYISTEVMRAIDKGEISASVSRLESYATCSYAYYLNYILRLNERPVFGMNALDVGNIFHDSLYNYSVLLKEAGLRLEDAGESEKEKYLPEAVKLAYKDFYDSGAYERAYDAYVESRVLDTMERTVDILAYQAKKGKFIPEHYETSLKSICDPAELKYELGNGSLLYLNGKIDRIDLARDDDRVYVKIIDYKSGDKKPDLTLTRAGIQIQLIFYLNAQTKALLRKGENVVPAGIFYYHVDDPVVNAEAETSSQDAEESIKKKLIPNGIIADRQDILGLFDEDLGKALETGSSYKSDVIRVTATKSGEPDKRSQTVSPEELSFLMKEVEKGVRESALKISEGKIERNPYRHGEKTGCDYCSYHSICGFSPEAFKDKYNDIKKIESIDDWRGRNGL